MRTTTVKATALSLALALMAGPATAAKRAAHPGYNANAQAIPGEGFGNGEVSAARAKVLEECNGTAGKLTDYSWGVRQSDVYRACMATHGQME